MPVRAFADETAVSPIIAVILLTAIVVVLSAMVFVLVSDVGDETGTDAPRLSLFTDSGTRSTNWLIKMGAATRDSSLSDYEFVHTTPDTGTIVYRVTDESGFINGNGLELFSGDLAGKNSDSLTAADTTTTKTDAQAGYRLRIQDISGDDLFTVADTIQLSYDGTDADGTYNQILPKGLHRVELRHVTTASIAATVTNAF